MPHPILDHAHLDAMTGGDTEFRDELLATFLASTSESWPTLIAPETAPEVRKKTAHRIKGAASNVGAVALAALCKAVEDNPDAGHSEKLEHAYSDLQRELGSLLTL